MEEGFVQGSLSLTQSKLATKDRQRLWDPLRESPKKETLMAKGFYQPNKKTTQPFTTGQRSTQFIVTDPSIKGIEKIL